MVDYEVETKLLPLVIVSTVSLHPHFCQKLLASSLH